MKKWMRRMALTLAGALLAGSLAVGAVAEEKDYTGAKFRIAWWGNDTRHAQTTQLVEEFEKAYPGLKIDVEYSGWGDYWSKLSTQAAGNDLPDVIQMDYAYVNAYADANLLLDLDSYVESGALDLANMSETTLAAGNASDGRMVALVAGTNAPAFIYDKAALAEAGVTISEAPTLDEFLAACKAVYEKTGKKSTFVGFNHFTRVMGEELYADDGKSVAFTAETLAKFWEISCQGEDEGYFLKIDDPRKDSDEANLSENVLWCVYLYSNVLESLESKTGMDLGMFTTPSATEKPASFMKPNMLWSVTAGTKNPDLAVAFLNYFANDTKTYDICGMDRGMPISSAIREYLEPSFNASQKKVSEFLAYLEDGHVSPIYKPEPAKTGEASDVQAEMTEQVNYRLVAPEDFLTTAQTVIDQMNAILAAE